MTAPAIPYTETHAVTDDYGRQLYTVTTVSGYPAENRAFLLAQVERLTLELRLARQALELSAQMQGVR